MVSTVSDRRPQALVSGVCCLWLAGPALLAAEDLISSEYNAFAGGLETNENPKSDSLANTYVLYASCRLLVISSTGCQR